MHFRDRLRECPIFFEVVPPLKRAEDQASEAKEVADVLASTRADAVNIPEIKGSGPDRLEPLEFTAVLRRHTDTPVVVNKVVVHLRGNEFERWLDDVSRHPVEGAVLVGGERSNIWYPGPTVLEADKALRHRLPQMALGNISIQTRLNEEKRLLDKTLIGGDFFTSQITYESATATRVLTKYQELTRLFRVKPATMVFGLSHVASRKDVEFLRILGVNIPEEVDRFLLSSDGGIEARSRETTVRVWREIAEFKKRHVPDVPIGATIEPVLTRNVRAGVDITEDVRKVAEEVGLRRR